MQDAKITVVDKKEITGVTFEIRQKDGKFVEDINYYVVKTKVADGYILNSTSKEVGMNHIHPRSCEVFYGRGTLLSSYRMFPTDRQK